MVNTIQIKRSNVAGKVPTAASLEVGELALNFPDKKIYTKEPGGAIVTLVPSHDTTIAAAAPASPRAHDLWLNTTTNLLSIWDGAKWVSTDTHQASTSATAPLNPATGMMWLDPAKKDLQIWDGAQWALVAFKNVTNTFTKPQIIDVNDASAALRVTQKGTGDCLRIEDEANPDATPFVIDKDGFVGIRTAPQNGFALNTNGPIRISESSTMIGSYGETASATPGVVFGSFTNHDFGLITNSAEHLRVKTDGKIGVRTRIPASDIELVSNGGKTGQLTVAGGPDSGTRQAVLYMSADPTAGANGVTIGASFYSGGYGPIKFETSNVETFRIQANGTLVSLPTYAFAIAGSALNVDSAGNIGRGSSSIKYKKDVEALDPVLTDRAVAGLRPVWYRSKTPAGDDKAEWSHIGLIAEEVAQVEKRLVKYKTKVVSVDDDGNRVVTNLETPIPEDVDYARLSVLLLAKVQQLETRLAKLEARP
jgi:hypothetical protein